MRARRTLTLLVMVAALSGCGTTGDLSIMPGSVSGPAPATGLQPIGPDGLQPVGAGAKPVYSTAAPAALDVIRPPDAAAAAFARAFLDTLQPRSIADRREYCGYFYLDAAGQIAATPPQTGNFATCTMPAPRPDRGIFASYHTHGAYDRGYDNEVPSAYDLQSDFAFGLDGYVATPGGRVWHVDEGSRSTRLVCGRGCVTDDPGYVTIPADEAAIQPLFTLAELMVR